MKRKFVPGDFLIEFKKYPDEALIGVSEVAALLQTSPAAVYKRLEGGIAPSPCVRSGKQIRFRVGDVRHWLLSLRVSKAGEGESKKAGRPRVQS